MSLHQSIEFQVDLDDEVEAEKVFERYLEKTNAKRNVLNFEYLITEEDGDIYINEIGEDDGGVNARRAVIDDGEVEENVLSQEQAEELKNKYEEVKN
jgi:hypothetical protein